MVQQGFYYDLMELFQVFSASQEDKRGSFLLRKMIACLKILGLQKVMHWSNILLPSCGRQFFGIHDIITWNQINY